MPKPNDPTSLAAMLKAEERAALRSASTVLSALQGCARAFDLVDGDVSNNIDLAQAVIRNADALVERLSAVQAFRHSIYLEEESRL